MNTQISHITPIVKPTASSLKPVERLELNTKVQALKTKYNLSNNTLATLFGKPLNVGNVASYCSGDSMPSGARAVHLAAFFKKPSSEIEGLIKAIPQSEKRIYVKKPKDVSMKTLIAIQELTEKIDRLTVLVSTLLSESEF